jgi:hypothetical protein
LLILRNGANFLAYTAYPKRSRFAPFLRLGTRVSASKDDNSTAPDRQIALCRGMYGRGNLVSVGGNTDSTTISERLSTLGFDADLCAIGDTGDAAVPVGAIDFRARSVQPVEHFGVGIAGAIARIHRDDGDARMGSR